MLLEYGKAEHALVLLVKGGVGWVTFALSVEAGRNAGA